MNSKPSFMTSGGINSCSKSLTVILPLLCSSAFSPPNGSHNHGGVIRMASTFLAWSMSFSHSTFLLPLQRTTFASSELINFYSTDCWSFLNKASSILSAFHFMTMSKQDSPSGTSRFAA